MAKKVFQKALSVGLSVALCAGMIAPAFAASFTDLQNAIDGKSDKNAITITLTAEDGTTSTTAGYGYGKNMDGTYEIEAWDGKDDQGKDTRNVKLNSTVERGNNEIQIRIQNNVNATLDLNGNTIDNNEVRIGRVGDTVPHATGGCAIKVYKGGVLTLEDSAAHMEEEEDSEGNKIQTYVSGKITGGVGSTSPIVGFQTGGVYNNGTFTMVGGTIEENKGDGVYNSSSGTFTMTGGAIEGSTGMGVYNFGGTFTMTGGVIADSGKVGVDNSKNNGKGSFTMIDGAITGNSGGVDNAFSSFTMEGGTINDNTGGPGGGVYNRGTFKMTGGTIEGNTSEANWMYRNGGAGGGVHNCGTFIMTDGTITKNNVSGYGIGGGVYNRGTFEMDGGTIDKNWANQGGGVYNAKYYDSDTAKFTMNGGSICSNVAIENGGGVLNGGTFTMAGNSPKTIKDNAANSSGSDIDSFSKISGLDTVNQNGETLKDGTPISGWYYDVRYNAFKDHRWEPTRVNEEYDEDSFDKSFVGLKAAYNGRYDFSLDLNGGAFPEEVVFESSYEAGQEDPKDPGEPVREGHTFLGWGVPGEDGTFTFDEIVDHNKTVGNVITDIDLVAQWDGYGYKITVNCNDGTPTTELEGKVGGDTPQKPADPTKDGYTFNSWKYEDEEGNSVDPFDPNYIPKKDGEVIKMVAQWTRNTNDDNNGGNGGGTPIDDEQVPLAGIFTRADAVGYLWQQAGEPEAELSDFPDVPEDHQWAVAIGWAQDMGIALADEEGNFRPDDLVLRSVESLDVSPEGELQEFLDRYAVYAGAEFEGHFLTLEGAFDDVIMGEEAQAIFDDFFAKLEAALAQAA